jgi:hypothetical protein
MYLMFSFRESCKWLTSYNTMPARSGGEWWHNHFTKHPGAKDKSPESFSNPNSRKPDKFKSMCNNCLNVELAAIRDKERDLKNKGIPFEEKSEMEHILESKSLS